MATKKAQEVAAQVVDAILYHRDSVSGRESSNPHLYEKSVENTEDGGMIVNFWSTQGFRHNCWIEAKIERNGFVHFNHCGDSGMKELVRKIREEL